MSRLIVALCVTAALGSGCRAPAAPAGEAGAAEPNPAVEERLRAHVRFLSETIGPRCGADDETHQQLEAAWRYLQSNLELLLLRRDDRSLVLQRYEHGGRLYSNIAVEIPGTAPEELVVIGAHYDSHCGSSGPHTPGADDNASGVAALLELARRFDARQRAEPDLLGRSVRFVAFTNEEPPTFQTGAMGSLLYAQQSRERGERIHAMLSLEMLGYYSDDPGSQQVPSGLGRLLSTLPERGDFLAFVGNLASRQLMADAVEAFRRGTSLPADGVAAPLIPQLGWSDHWAFWKQGYPAVMVTDTAMLRNPHYHAASDTWDTLDYHRMAQAVDGLEEVIVTLARVVLERR